MKGVETQQAALAQPEYRATILVVDDEDSFHDVADRYLGRTHRLIGAYNGRQTIEALERHHIDVVLLDLNLPDINGLQLLGAILAERDDAEIIVVTAHSEIRNAVDAVKKGAFDFIAKTYENFKQLGAHVERALENRRRKREQMEARTRLAWLRDAFKLLDDTRSKAMREVVALARQVAATPISILIEGESGVGKEVMARYLHAYSDRASRPFVAVNLAAVPRSLIESHLFGHVKGAFTGADKAHTGKFEMAEGGTLFLDEIGELDANAQVQLLRVLQEREIERLGAQEATPVDVRIVAATNAKLQEAVAEGRFREDLYYRLNVVHLPIPPLRKRTEDIPELVRLLADKQATRMGRETPRFTRDAMSVLRDYQWPGNVRELENLVMRLVAVSPGKAIVADDIPPEYCLPALNRIAEKVARRGVNGAEEQRLYFLARDQFERYLVRVMVNRCNGDKRAAAKALGVSFSTVKEKLRGHKNDWSLDL